MTYFQKSPVERDSQQLNDQKAQKPVFRNTIPSFFARLRRHFGFFYWGSRALGIRQQSRSTISMCTSAINLVKNIMQMCSPFCYKCEFCVVFRRCLVQTALFLAAELIDDIVE